MKVHIKSSSCSCTLMFFELCLLGFVKFTITIKLCNFTILKQQQQQKINLLILFEESSNVVHLSLTF